MTSLNKPEISILNLMKPGRKFIVLSAIFLTGLFLFLGRSALEQINNMRQANSLRQLCELAVKAGSLVHELQAERGKTVGFVGAGSGVLPQELKEQRDKTDMAAREMRDYSSRHMNDISSAGLAGTLDAAWKNIAGLEDVRASVDASDLPLRQTIERYARLIDPFLRIISGIPPSMTESESFPSLAAYMNLLNLKESAGIERSALYSLFIEDTSDPLIFQRAEATAASQDIFLKNFLSYASADQKDYYSRKTQRPFMDEIKRMRGLLLENTQGPWEVDPSFWFQTATERIDALKEVGDYIVTDLITYSGNIEKKAHSSILNIIPMVTTILMTLTVYFLASMSMLLRKGLAILGCGLFLGMTFHSVAEYCEAIGLISIDALVVMMPVLVTAGSVVIIVAGIYTFYNVTTPLRTVLGYIKNFSLNAQTFDISPELKDLKNELGEFARSFHGLIKRLQETTVSKTHFESIISTANDAFISMDEEGSIAGWNPAAERIFGWPTQEVIGKPMAQTIIPLQYREAHLKGLSRFIGTGEGTVLGKTLDLSALHRDGHEFPIEITIWAVRRDKKYQFNAFIRDVTQRQKAHEALAEREKTLHSMFRNLQEAHENLKMTQHQLVQSEKLASIGQLAAGVAHEINNPVGFINNNMEILEQYIAGYTKIARLAGQIKESVDRGDLAKAKTTAGELAALEKEINLDYVLGDTTNLLRHNRAGIERIQKIVMDLRTFAREDKDEMERVKIEEVIEGILTIVQSEIKYKAKLEKNYGDTPPVECNPQRLGQVFLNLIVNALHAIEGTGTIEIKTYTQDRFVRVDVRDTGKGIEEQNLGKVFDPFFTTKPVGQGTGLGLSVSHEIVKKHGGEMAVRSKVGEGTTFTVSLPINQEKSFKQIIPELPR